MHRPGPWKFGDEYGPVMDEIVDATGRTVCVVWTHRSRSQLRAVSHRREADPAPDLLAVAQLIIAAPDLLKALKLAYQDAERCCQLAGRHSDVRWMPEALAAIEKAERICHA